MGEPCCGQQIGPEKIKLGGNACFTCLGCSQAHLLEQGHYYEKCSPLVMGETKADPYRPMTSVDECIVAWVGPCCHIDATDWEDDCLAHVYPGAHAIKQCVNWPCDEEGNPLFTVEDIELIAHANSDCCSSLETLKECEQAPAWLADQNEPAKGKVTA